MRVRRAGITAAWGLVAALLVGCDQGGDADAGAGETPSPLVASNAMLGAPEVGTCWRVPASLARDSGYWFDDSKTTSCSNMHTTETVAVIELDEATPDAADVRGETCEREAREYVGQSLEAWVPLGASMFLPSRQAVDDGASWVRCDIWFPEDYAGLSITPVEFSGRDAVTRRDDELWVCLDQDPYEQRQPYVPCDRPHLYEQTGRLALASPRTYPSLERAHGYYQCRDLTREQRTRGDAVVVVWPPKVFFHPRLEIEVPCFLYRKDGKPLAPRP